MFLRYSVRPCLTLAVILVSFVATLPAALRDQLTTTEARQLQREARLVFELLQNYHYSGRPFLELKNQELLGSFLSEIDAQHNFLLQPDVDFVTRRFGQSLRTVYLARGDLQPAFEIFELFQKRVSERSAWIAERLEHEIDFSTEGEVDPSAPTMPAADAATADARWEIILKDAVLHEIAAGRTPAAARAEVARRYRELDRTILSLDPLLVRERFFDSVIRAYDPHSGYFSADSAQEFAVSMGQSLAGVGLSLAKRDGRCVVESIEAGGPADLHSSLEPGDTIIAIAEGEAPWRELAPLRLREIVALVRGQAGAALRIAYSPAGTDKRRELTLTRAIVIASDDRAWGGVAQVPAATGGPHRIGWVHLPSFYATPATAGPASSVTRDVRELLDRMSVATLDALVVDLRSNPGGALDEAVALSGLFLPPNSTVLHTRLPNGKSTEFKTAADGAPLFRGPLVVLTNTHSASASEAFAGAMQFHRRAAILGDTATYGKGTVQSYIELSSAARVPQTETANWGTLRLTAQRLYRPDGRALQRAGVSADLVLPSPGGKPAPREADLPGALAEETLPGVNVASAALGDREGTWITSETLERLRLRLQDDVSQLPEWKLWSEEAALRDSLATAKRPLQLAYRQDLRTAELALRESLRRTRRALAGSLALKSEACDLAAIATAAQASSEALRAFDPAALEAAVIIETDARQRRKLRASQVDFTRFTGDSEALATAFSRGAGQTLSPTVLAEALRDFTLCEERTPAAWRECFRMHLSAAEWTDDRLARGLSALLAAVPEIEPEMKRERTALDIPLRQALRIASAWAETLSTAPAASL